MSTSKTVDGVITFPSTLTLPSLTANQSLMTSGNNQVVSLFPSVIPLPLSTSSIVRVYNTIPTNTQTALYTCPAGYYAVIIALNQYCGSGSSVTNLVEVSPNGGTTNYWLKSNTISLNACAYINPGYTLLPGDSLMVTPGGSSQTFTANFLLIPSTGNFQVITLRNIPTGPTTLYTCPAGMNAYFVNNAAGDSDCVFNIAQGIPTMATQSTSYHYTLNAVINSTTYVIGAATSSSASQTNFTGTGLGFLGPGDSINVVATGNNTASHMWLALMQYPTSI